MKTNKKEDKISARQALHLNWRALKLWYGRYPGAALSIALCAGVSAFTPYATIYLSAQIINKLAGARNPQVLFRLALITVLSIGALALLQAALTRWKNCHEAGHYYKSTRFFSDKMLDMDFCSVDDPHTHDLRAQACNGKIGEERSGTFCSIWISCFELLSGF